VPYRNFPVIYFPQKKKIKLSGKLLTKKNRSDQRNKRNFNTSVYLGAQNLKKLLDRNLNLLIFDKEQSSSDSGGEYTGS